MAGISAVLIDAGGTLWPDRWPERIEDAGCRARTIAAALPWLSRESALELARDLEAAARQSEPGLVDGLRLVREIARLRRLPLDEQEILAVRRAMCLPAAGRIELFPRARELLATIKALGLTCVIVSNATWRDGDAYGRDFDALGVGRFVDGVVSSVDVGRRKPHTAMFETAMAVTCCPAARCVIVGNSEANDIAPALALGMRAVRVVIEEPAPSTSAAHAIVRSLHEAAELLRSWMWADG